MAMTHRALKKLEIVDPARATLARQMMTYLNHLAGSAERGEVRQDASALRAEEHMLEARLGGLPDYDSWTKLSSSDVMAVCGRGSTR